MLDHAVFLLDKWIQHPEHGLLEIVDTPEWLVPFGGGAPMENPVPSPMSFYNNYEHSPLANDDGPDHVPAWLTIGVTDVPVSVEQNKRVLIGKECLIAMMFITGPDVDPVRMGKAFGLLSRACTISLHRYNSQDKSAGYREWNGIKIHQVGPVIEHRVTAAVGRRKCWGMIEVHAIVVETYS
jgi:hypothetical protein